MAAGIGVPGLKGHVDRSSLPSDGLLHFPLRGVRRGGVEVECDHGLFAGIGDLVGLVFLD